MPVRSLLHHALEGSRKRLHHLCFGAAGNDFSGTRGAVRRAGVAKEARA